MVDIVLPSMQAVKAVTDFVNKLSREDTYLSFAGEEYSLAYEKNWLKNVLVKIKFKKMYLIWVVYDGQIVGSCDLDMGLSRRNHIATIGLMVDEDFRRQGLGKYLMESILKKAREMGFKIVKLDVFDDNIAGKALYEKLGFIECGRIPNGLFRKGNYVDDVWLYKNLEEAK